MRITFLGLTLSSSWGNGHATPLRAIIRALYHRGHRVTFFEKDVPYYANHRDLESPEFCELRLYEDWTTVRNDALASVHESDVVVTTSYLPDGAKIAHELLGLTTPLRVYYDMDTPVTLAKFAEGVDPEYVTRKQLCEYDLVLSFTGGRALEILRSEYGVAHAVPIYGCVDPDVHARTAPNEYFANDFSYMGTYAADRQAKLDALFFDAARQLPEQKFMVVGSLFPDGLDWPQNVWYKPHTAPSDHAAFYSSSRATLNITRGSMATLGHCPSGRFFEAAACGTPLISDYFCGIDEFFDCENEIAIAHDTGDVVKILRGSDDQLRAMARRARERTLDEHTGNVRAGQMIAAFVRAMNKSFAEVA